jgi:hypothetical protein
MRNCFANAAVEVVSIICTGNDPRALIRLVAFDYEVDEDKVTIISESDGPEQGIYQVLFPGINIPIRYDRVGSVYMRHVSAPPLPHEVPNQVTPPGKL